MKFPNEDVIMQLNTSTTVADAKLALRIQKEIPDVENIRFFYNGREMIDSKTLGNFSYGVGTIIQAMIKWILYFLIYNWSLISLITLS